jgi:hypothetical protein
MKKVLSIDIGIVNLGYVFAEIEEDINIIYCDRVDITYIKHDIIKWCDCKLLHENCIPDYLDHFVQENNTFFEEADIILIERQPPVGITNVQDLLFTRFRHKVKLVSPNMIHKYFRMSKDYDIRKIESEKISFEYLKDSFNFLNNVRRHDISDATLMLIWYYKKNKPKVIVDNFEQFRFNFTEKLNT